ncbi:nitrous oxide-stimulated promoter family protein [Vescimonas fastidiosa]|uniref:nitrous oxide-stimulated promoter family protein n=1 Tax=Vescimonas fastidiosa TaxID=2714353 RepID=UPI0038B68DA2
MVRRYCRDVHGGRGEELCPACAALLEYARQRRDRCPHGEISGCCPISRNASSAPAAMNSTSPTTASSWRTT